MAKQKAVVVVVMGSTDARYATDASGELNKLLDDGWVVRAVHPVTSAGGGSSAY